RQALLWEDQHRNDNWLLRDQAYTEVLPWVDEHRDELTGPEMEFLEASREQRDQQLQSTRRTRIFAITVTAIATLALALAVLAFIFAQNANSAKLDESIQASKAKTAEAQAIDQRNIARAAKATAQMSEQEAQNQAKISRIGELAAQSVSLRDKNFLISLLLG